ncbi:helix-turn-helix transcriptional regulator [Vagococcus bubulae]|uniref:helix-turn-helix transcriptional regulator n=1 Tax=Vagococcus bubulae TaxID=1977868 RepID=UPI0022E97764|nr:helix-turn-helix domain-containing protein [Vagococcus bubulae]
MSDKNSYPFNLSLLKGNDYIAKKSNLIRLFFIVEGTCLVNHQEAEYTMLEKDIFILNTYDQVWVHFDSQDTILGCIEIDTSQLSDLFQIRWQPYYECFSMKQHHFIQQDERFTQLRSLVLSLFSAFFTPINDSVFLIYNKLFDLISYMDEAFQPVTPQIVQKQDDVISNILKTINQRYAQPILLEDLAKESFLSYNYLSKKFKEQTGETFREYLKQIRLNHAAKELCQSDESILKIAVNNGFSSSKSFHKMFKDYFGVTPKKYRTQNHLTNIHQFKHQNQYTLLDRQSIMAILARKLMQAEVINNTVNTKIHSQINLSQKKNPISLPKMIINLGLASNWNKAIVKEDLKQVIEELPVDLIRFHNFLSDDTKATDFMMFSHYQENNQLFEYIFKHHKNPMVSLKYDASKTLSMEEWFDKQCQFIHQLIKHNGVENCSNIYFEWHFSHEDMANQFKLFSRFYSYINKELPHPIIGIFLGNVYELSDIESIDYYLKKIAESMLTIRFYSYKSKPNNVSLWDEHTKISMEDYQNKNVALIKLLLDRYSLTGDILLVDWDTLVGHGKTFAGTFFRSALFVKDMLQLSTSVQGVGVWLNSEALNDATLSSTLKNNLSLFLDLSLKRPAYLSIELLSKLRGDEVYHDDFVYIFKQQDTLMILLLNPSYIDPQMSIDADYIQNQTKSFDLVIGQINKGKYLKKTYSLDKDNGGIYNQWLKIGGLTELDEEGLNYLKKKLLLSLEVSVQHLSNEFNVKETLTFNACRLIVLSYLSE